MKFNIRQALVKTIIQMCFECQYWSTFLEYGTVKSDSVKRSKMCPLPFTKCPTFSTEWIIVQVWIKRRKREWWILSNSWQSEYTGRSLKMNCVGVWYWQLGEAEFLLSSLVSAVTTCLLPILRIVACLLKSSILWTSSESASFGLPCQFLYIFRYNIIG